MDLNAFARLGNRGIGRGRLFVGTLLLFAAVLSWGIGFTMSPRGETVAGTDYLRGTIVTFKRNSAAGTLALAALAAWLLFTPRGPKTPVRFWTLIALFGLLAGSSIYTLISLRPSAQHAGSVDEKLAANAVDWNTSGAASGTVAVNVGGAPPFDSGQREMPGAITAPAAEANRRTTLEERRPSREADVAEGQPAEEDMDVRGGGEAADNESDENAQ